jgi:2-hydroxychromene-2-carboxylate isomerase
MLGADEPWIGAFCRGIMRLNFAQDREIDSPEAVSEVLMQQGLPAQTIIADALADANKLALREQTERARAKGVFGAPTFFVGAEMFWGNDRLDDALACAAGLPLAGN